jgi:hypothetical protein
MISQGNFFKAFYNDPDVKIISSRFDQGDYPQDRLLRLSNDFEMLSYNPEKKYFGHYLKSKPNTFQIPVGVINEPLLTTIEVPEKTILCSSQYSTQSRKTPLPHFDFVEYFEKSDQETYFKNLAKSKFVISPHGNFPDCYRHWESMYLSAIPITLFHEDLKNFYDLPILFLNSWEELTEDLLKTSYYTIINKSREKLDINYWVWFIRNS